LKIISNDINKSSMVSVMAIRVSTKDCPGLCLTAGVECAIEEIMICPTKARLMDEIEQKRALLEDVWVLEILEPA
jgi:hypothetical protein